MKRAARPKTDDASLPRAGAALVHEPRLFTDARLLGALHAELETKEPAPSAARSLFQIGMLQGLRDAQGALSLVGDAAAPPASGTGATPLLSIALDPRPAGTPQGEVAIVGRWPQAHEAGARLARLGRTADPACGLSAGYTAGWYSGLLERDLVAVERSCVARGDARCGFELRDAEAWRERRDPQALWVLEDLPFAAFRVLAARPGEAEPLRPADGATEAEAPVVHVWGPVMVIPFAGVEEALRGLDLIGRDPAACEVSVVIVDLTGAALDDGFDAAALELVVTTARGWGAEAILAGVSALSASAVEDLETQGVTAYKDLPLAIASAFQTVRSQGRTL